MAEDLGVRYVLEGSFRKSGEKVRITAQLIDATKGHHIWAERYEGEIKDIFNFQDLITYKIVTSLGVELAEGDQMRIWSKRFQNHPELFLSFYQAWGHFNKRTPENNHKARKIWKEVAMKLPKNDRSLIYSCIAVTYLTEIFAGWSTSSEKTLEKAHELAIKTLVLDKSNPEAYGIMAWIYLFKRDYDKAIEMGKHSVILCPNCADLIAYYGIVQNYACRFDEAISLLEKAIRLNPMPPFNIIAYLGVSYYHAGRYDDAIETLKKALKLNSRNLLINMGMTVAYVLSGRESEAKERAKILLNLYPKFSIQQFNSFYKDPEVTKRIISAFRKVGIPET